jgi:hypothetical protein
MVSILIGWTLGSPSGALGSRGIALAISGYRNFVARFLAENRTRTRLRRCELLHSRLGLLQRLCRFHAKRSAIVKNSQNVERCHHDDQSGDTVGRNEKAIPNSATARNASQDLRYREG